MKKTGRWVLILLTLINLFNYLDRYILVALSPTIQKDLSLSDTQVGFLATAFMFSYFLISPVFGWLGDRKPRLKLMGTGVGLWSLATAASGMVSGFPGLLSARFSVGVGEAAYGSISPSVLRDLYPKEVCGKIFAIFFMAIPVGSALGYLLGGILEKAVGWRHAFFVAGVPGILLAVFLFFMREPKRGTFDQEKAETVPMKEMISALVRNPNYVLTVLGYCAYTFVLGGVAVWIPHFMLRYLNIEPANGNMIFGGITVGAGFLGTFIGGAWADKWAKRGTDAYLKLSALSMFAALPVFVLVLETRNFPLFCFFVFLLEFLLFLSTSPINAQIVNCVSPSIRATANAMSIFMIHILGDAISPPLVGFISTKSNLLVGMYIFTVAIFASGMIWLWKVIFYWETLPWPVEAMKLPKSQCHRGYHPMGVMENSIAAFVGAEKAGAKMVELDVRLCAEGIPVVIHDADTQRISGKAGSVNKLSQKDLAALNVPTLAEVLKSISIFVNIELKSEQARSDGLEAAVAEVVKASGAERRVIFSSFNPLALRRLSKFLPEVPRALLVSGEKSEKNAFYLRKAMLAFLARPHMLNLDQALYDASAAKRYAARGVPVAVWTVEDRENARNSLALGAESIISPVPNIV